MTNSEATPAFSEFQPRSGRGSSAPESAPSGPTGAIATGSGRAPGWVRDSLERWPQTAPFVTVGALSVVAGGLVAAVSGPSGFENGSWLAAFLVLVGGVAQIVLGGAQALISEEPPSRSLVRAEAITWNLAAVGVVVGTLVALPVVTSMAGMLTVASLALFLSGARRIAPGMRLISFCYRALIVVVLLSTPVGLVLAWLRHG